MKLSYAETKALLLASVDASPEGSAAAAASLTGGRLNVAAAMQALALVLKARGKALPPGLALEDPGMADVQRRLLEGEWAKGLLSKPVVPAAPTAAPTLPAGQTQPQPQPQVTLSGGAVLLEEEAPKQQQQPTQKPFEVAQDKEEGTQPRMQKAADPGTQPQQEDPASSQEDEPSGAADAPLPADSAAVAAQSLPSDAGQKKRAMRLRPFPRQRVTG